MLWSTTKSPELATQLDSRCRHHITHWAKKTAEHVLRNGSQTSPKATPGAEIFLPQRRTSEARSAQHMREVLSHLHHPIARELPEPYWTMLLSANAGRDSTPRNQPHARVESQTFRNVSTRIASHYLLTYNPTTFVFVRFTPPREPLKSADHVGTSSPTQSINTNAESHLCASEFALATPSASFLFVCWTSFVHLLEV